MTALAFKKATRKKTKARIAIMGASGSGKTLWAIRLAAQLGKRTAVCDTENRSASLYIGEHGLDFDVVELDPEDEGGYDPRRYIDAIKLAEREGYDTIVLDSLSHAWTGTGGALEMVDQSNNKFAAWKDVTPIQNALMDAITHCKIHIIATLRSKTEYVLEEETDKKGRKKQVPKRIGIAPIQRAGMEYEFSIFAECDLDTHDLKVTKTRIGFCDSKRYATSQVEGFGAALLNFHDSGEAPTLPAAAQPQPAKLSSVPTPHAPASPPTKTAANYPDKQWAGVPFGSVSGEALANYIAYYTERLPQLTQENHRLAVRATIAAAEAELQMRIVDSEKGELPDQEIGAPFLADPSDDPMLA